MLFHKIQTKHTHTMYASGTEERELKLRFIAFLAWLAVTVILVGTAIYFYSSGWSDGATKILSIVSSVVGSGGLGTFLGERSTAKEVGKIH